MNEMEFMTTEELDALFERDALFNRDGREPEESEGNGNE